MAGKKPKKGHPPPAATVGGGSATAFGVLARSLMAIGLVAAVVAGVSWVGDQAGARVADRDRYQTPVADIRVEPPPGTDRVAFLSEVRHLGRLPATVSAVDPQTPATLAAAFARHPWVERVESISVAADRSITAKLIHRLPTLAVRVTLDLDLRVVDRTGVLLPPGTPSTGLPELRPPVPASTAKPGERWADDTVTRAAALADEHRARKLTRIEKSPTGWRLLPESGPALVVRF